MFEDNVKLLHSFKNGNNKISCLFVFYKDSPGFWTKNELEKASIDMERVIRNLPQ